MTEAVRAPLPVRARAFEAADRLGSLPGTFLYDFGTPGWPDGWSPFGLDPRHVGSELDGIPFDDPATGAPVWDMVPVAQTNDLEIRASGPGRPDGVAAGYRAFDGFRPLTEMRYRSAGGGLQAVDVTHVHRRRLGTEGRALLVLGYGGAGARGEYDGSRLRRKRRLLGRALVEHASWTFGLTNLHNRYHVGAHGGVLPVPGYGYESIYNRLLADVDDADARRTRYRNDLVLSADGPVAGAPLALRLFRTTGTLQYRADTDTTTARTARTGMAARWRTESLPVPVSASVSGYVESVRSGEAFGSATGGRSVFDAVVGVHPARGALRADLSVGAARLDGHVRASGSADAAWEASVLRAHASAAVTPVRRSLVEIRGFGPTFRGLPGANPSTDRQVRAGVGLDAGPLRLGATLFARSQSRPLYLLLDADSDTVRAATGADALRSDGVVVDLGLRERSARGLYVTGTATWNRRGRPSDPAAARADAALPEWHGRLRLGLRARLFAGDLDVDLAVQARAWSAMQGRRLHAPTGLLVLPDPSARAVPASAIVDVTLDAGIRSAVVFLAMENALSGTAVTPGNQLVPDYPYPERRVRFGVYWPIFD